MHPRKTDVTWTETLSNSLTQSKRIKLIMSYFFLASYLRLTKCLWDWVENCGAASFKVMIFGGIFQYFKNQVSKRWNKCKVGMRPLYLLCIYCLECFFFSKKYTCHIVMCILYHKKYAYYLIFVIEFCKSGIQNKLYDNIKHYLEWLIWQY